MQVCVGFCNNPDSISAGTQAVQHALSKTTKKDSCDLVLLFCTARHDQKLLRQAVVEATGNACCIYGGGAVGIITNDDFGYAGDQVGVACIWFDGNECKVLTECDLLDGEHNTGLRLGSQLSTAGINPESPMLLFYDSVDQTQNKMRLLMATWLLEGIEENLGFLPNIVGAGLQGDHICTPTRQYIGDKMGEHCAFAVTFSEDIHMDHVIMHGCRPASPYYTVTKADAQTILEIDGEPALQFMDRLLGPALSPENYPFFLLFGVNHNKRWAEFEEDNYSSRLCLAIDKERNGIVMFEPDMVEGTMFQVMYRSLALDYMKPKIQELFDRLGDREPIFAMYIDCAGRCAGYGGIDMEDAYVIQDAFKDGIPLLGLYTGVEIASGEGKPRGLDWTGVLCVFSKSSIGSDATKISKKIPIPDVVAETNTGKAELSLNSIKKLSEQNIAKILELDARSIVIRYELEQKRQGFRLLAELAVFLSKGEIDESVFHETAQRMNAALNMQKTAVLTLDADGQFTPSVLQGYTTEEKFAISRQKADLNAELPDMKKTLLVTAANSEDYLAKLRKTLMLPYFISTPIVIENITVALLITGRTVEAPPFLSRLTHNDMETVQAISALFGSVLMHQKLDLANKLAQTDELTGLLNRRALEWQTITLLNSEMSHGKTSAFVMIDIDYFKEVNDTYGHIVGDRTLKVLAKMLTDSFRATDVIARLGGDEFVMYCMLVADIEPFIGKIEKLVRNWNNSPIIVTDDVSFHSSLSIGISVAPRDGTSYNELLHKADIALYESKQNGRNRYTIYDGGTKGQ